MQTKILLLSDVRRNEFTLFALSYGRVVIYTLRDKRGKLVFLGKNCGNFAISSIVLIIFSPWVHIQCT
jgi:hypothetical protein